MRTHCWPCLLVPFAALACSSSTTPSTASDGGSSSSRDASLGKKAHDGGKTSPDAVASGAVDAGIARADGPVLPPADAGIPTDAQHIGGDASAPRSYTITNHCQSTVWAAALPKTTFPNPDGLVEMAPGYSFQVGVDNGWSGRIWGKTGCTTTAGNTTCESDGIPATLAELTLTNNPDGGLDFYDVSLVDGFNLPIELIAVGHAPNPQQPYNCGSPSCVVNLNATCPAVLQDKTDSGAVIACANDDCKVLADNDASSPDCNYPNQYTEFFKTPCPTAYSFPYDDPTSTFTCKGVNSYAVVFCP